MPELIIHIPDKKVYLARIENNGETIAHAAIPKNREFVSGESYILADIRTPQYDFELQEHYGANIFVFLSEGSKKHNALIICGGALDDNGDILPIGSAGFRVSNSSISTLIKIWNEERTLTIKIVEEKIGFIGGMFKPKSSRHPVRTVKKSTWKNMLGGRHSFDDDLLDDDEILLALLLKPNSEEEDDFGNEDARHSGAEVEEDVLEKGGVLDSSGVEVEGEPPLIVDISETLPSSHATPEELETALTVPMETLNDEGATNTSADTLVDSDTAY